MPTMSDIHRLPLTGHDLPYQAPEHVPARVHRDPETGLWVWEHACSHRLDSRPFHGIPMLSWERAFAVAHFHVEWCA